MNKLKTEENAIASPSEERTMLDDLLADLPTRPQRQDSTKEQLADLRLVANRLGMYDAADAIRQLFETDVLETIKYGCHCEVELDDREPDGCVIDEGLYQDCLYAKEDMRKEQCEYWCVCGS